MFLRNMISLVNNNLKELEMRIQFAEINLSQEKITNEEVYNALSHLAKINELGVDLSMYENLRVQPNSLRLNVDVYLYARDTLNEARLLRERIIYGTDRGN